LDASDPAFFEELTRRGQPLPVIRQQDQKEDVEFGPIYRCLDSDEKPKSLAECRNLEKIKSEFVLVDGYLYRFWIGFRNRWSGPKGARLLCVPVAHRTAVMAAAHDSAYGGGHFGFDKTYAQVKSRLYWGTSAKDVREYVKTCPVCQLRNVSPRVTGMMENITVPTRRWEQCAMDIVGPVDPPTRNGNQYMLVVVDYLTRWPEVIAMRDQTAYTVARAWINRVIARHGIPDRVITDQGSNFTSDLMRQVYGHMGIERNATTSYHPQSNGVVERFNRTLKDMLSKLIADRKDDWDELLEWALANFRAVPSVATGDTPFFLMTGRDPRMPLDTMGGAAGRRRDALADGDKSQFVEVLMDIAQRARESILESQRKMKLRHDVSAKTKPLVVGDLVKLRVRARKPGHKLRMRYTGPYRIIRRHEKSDNVFVIEMAHGKRKTVNQVYLERWYSRLADT
jgi:hypothetical protein